MEMNEVWLDRLECHLETLEKRLDKLTREVRQNRIELAKAHNRLVDKFASHSAEYQNPALTDNMDSLRVELLK